MQNVLTQIAMDKYKFINGLYDAAVNIYSQHGEDGIIRKIASDLHLEFTYLDVGAHDGHYMSNTQALRERGWCGVCVECDPEKTRHLRVQEQKYPGTVVIEQEANVGNIVGLFDTASIGEELTLLDLDTDHFDYQMWEVLLENERRADIVVIEADVAMPPGVRHIYDPADPDPHSSFTSICDLASRYDYRLAFHTGLNCIFVAGEFRYVPEDVKPEDLWLSNGSVRETFFRAVEKRSLEQKG